ncbi:hypothetical protein TanjilG_32908 [Lupinus angustifolius]|uniref:Protein CHUP1, chloroplastic n=1 Tax=Lupinus angustifolius TaxID=3871 RepID=A0A4P1RPF9_LUPAN|nr:hypothetical protein TanjilG_32908 [Lupinus angustifolius]
MSLEESEYEVISLNTNFEAEIARNALLEKENKELRQEIAQLKSQIISLKAHNIERKSIFWKKTEIHFHEPVPRYDKSAIARVPMPPPRPSSKPLPSHKNEKGMKMQPTITAPPPPPTPPKSLAGLKTVRRVPELIELYRSLSRKDANIDNKTNHNGIPAVAFTRNMIEEIQNRSTFLSSIKSDVERKGELISFLIKKVESASFSNISEVDGFVKWLDGKLSSLVDECSVLKHFPHWPESKADALREASCNYRDLKNLESEVLSFEDNPKEDLPQALRRVQALQDRLERSVNNVERTRESTSRRYRNFHIPWEWMLDTGLIGQMKLSSLRLAKELMKRITKELEQNEVFQEDNLILLQGVKFAFRIHQVDLIQRPYKHSKN